MAFRPTPALLRWLKAGFAHGPALPPEVQRAREVIAAIDAGGTPLNPATINAIARQLGLEVSRKAPVEETIERIRAALERCMPALTRRAEMSRAWLICTTTWWLPCRWSINHFIPHLRTPAHSSDRGRCRNTWIWR